MSMGLCPTRASLLVLILPTWSCMSRQILLQSHHLLRHFDYLNQSRTYLVAECPVSFCWPKFQSIFNPCNRPSIATDDRKQYQCQNSVVNNKTGPLFLEVNCYQKKVLAFYHNFIFFCHCLHRWERHNWDWWQRYESIWPETTVLFVSVAHFEFVVLLRDSFTVVPKSWAQFKALNVLCWSETPRVGFPPALSEDFCTLIQTLSTSSFASLNVTSFRHVFQKRHKDIQRF